MTKIKTSQSEKSWSERYLENIYTATSLMYGLGLLTGGLALYEALVEKDFIRTRELGYLTTYSALMGTLFKLNGEIRYLSPRERESRDFWGRKIK